MTIKNNFQPKYFPLIFNLFSSLWLISDLISIKIISFYGITLTGGFFTFPLVMTLNCLIVEVYGYKNSRQAIWAGTFINLLYLFSINLINLIPASPAWKFQTEFQSILIPQTRIIIASIIGFWFYAFINNYIMIKLKFKSKNLILRILMASLLAISIDLALYFTIAFLGITPIKLLKKMFIYAYLKKITCEILLLPLTWYLIDVFKKIEDFEVYDFDTNFTPFSLENIYDFHTRKKLI